MIENYYQVLGVSKNSSKQEIVSAYKKLAKKYHPDNKETGNQDRMQKINEAYQTLKDEKKRQKYDFSLDAKNNPFAGFGQDDIFKDFGDFKNFNIKVKRSADENLETIFEVFGKDKNFHSKRSSTKDLNLKYEISLVDAFRGKKRENLIIKLDDGTKRNVCVDIPPGINHGDKIKITGQGKDWPNPEAGDLYIIILIKSDEQFVRVKNNLKVEKSINVLDAMIDNSVEITDLENKKLLVKIPPGFESGQELRVPNRGMPIMNSSGRGDLLVKIFFSFTQPKQISQEQKQVLKEIKNKL